MAGTPSEEELRRDEAIIRQAGGAEAAARQRSKGRLTARERVAALLDPGTGLLELGLWWGWGMYADWGGAPAAGVITGIGTVCGRRVMVVANDATVKAGAFFPATVKKVLRAQRVAADCRLPLAYLVDSAGVFLPLQDEVFPDEDDFGRIFRNAARLSAAGVPQLAAVMGPCVAGGAYLPVLCDTLIMTEGAGLYLAAPALVKAAIGQVIDEAGLGGAGVHSRISGTADFREPDDPAALDRLRKLIAQLPPGGDDAGYAPRVEPVAPDAGAAAGLPGLVPADGRGEYDARRLIDGLVDAGSRQEYRAEHGGSLVCCFARLDGRAIGVVADQRTRVKPAAGPVQFGGVIYADAADKAARFLMDCGQSRLPVLFVQDVNGFMVGRDSEHEGIIRRGAKLVNAVANLPTPKITLVAGGSFGAGNYALCGKAFDPRFVFAWPTARVAVMGGAQAADTLFQLAVRARAKPATGKARDSDAPAAPTTAPDGAGGAADRDDDTQELRRRIAAEYERQTDVRYGAARGWVDAIVGPAGTRAVLAEALACAMRAGPELPLRTGVLQT